MEGGGTGNIGLLVQSESEDMCSGLMANPTGGNFVGSSVLVIFSHHHSWLLSYPHSS